MTHETVSEFEAVFDVTEHLLVDGDIHVTLTKHDVYIYGINPLGSHTSTLPLPGPSEWSGAGSGR